ncbi:hypothetical protein M413DRAFT_236611 [Hebeloma cylindrosporum]|uniref:Uncharacterized protein n=1 Tax=Hebeloma cylindrosporum TaxID=76867 RepID=A0A0C3BR73_HEBCY|nr:hypothetical protein M413DRAFT_236611 [Hebeloma cylindrosporum h7]
MSSALRNDQARGGSGESTFTLVDVPDAAVNRVSRLGCGRVAKSSERRRRGNARQKRRRRRERRIWGGWARKLRQEQEALMAKIKDRSKRKSALADRKRAAAQTRM